MKKFAVILYTTIVGGHEFQALELIKDLSKYNSVDIYIDYRLELEKLNIEYDKSKIHYLNLFKKGNFLLQYIHSFKLRKLSLEFSRYDEIVISGGSIESTIALGYALKNLSPSAYVPMFIDRQKLWNSKIGILYNLLHYLFCKPLKEIITINHIQSRLFSKYKKAIVLQNRINNQQPISNIHDTKAENLNAENKLYFVGRIERSKGILELVEMLDSQLNPFKDFIIIGDGSLMNKLKVKVNSLQHIREQSHLLSSNYVLVSNSYLEGEPLAIREANQRKSIVIASDIDGHRGCVTRQNRFKNKEQLLELLNLAYQNKLQISTNYSINEIENSRKRTIEKLSI